MNKNLNINCPIGTTGYGITSLNIVKNLYNIRDINIALFLIGSSIEVNLPEEKKLIQQLYAKSSSFDYDAPCLKIWHQNDLASKIGNGKYYTFPFFELDRLSDRDKHHINFSDHIFVASNWAKNVLLDNNIYKPISVCPLAVDCSIFKSNDNIISINDDKYIFCHIGKWEKRKGQDFLIKAFDAAFDTNDNVELRLVPHNPFLTQSELSEWYNLIISAKLKDKIKVYNRLPTQLDLAKFINEADCCIFPSRAEGWNNEIPECMALNKPIIATNYSAHTEYCNSDNCYLIDIDELEPGNDGKWFFGEGNWAKLGDKQFEQTVNYMRNVYKNHITTNQFGYETAQKYSWINTVQIIHDKIFQVK